jgi:hypothetical protein
MAVVGCLTIALPRDFLDAPEASIRSIFMGDSL